LKPESFRVAFGTTEVVPFPIIVECPAFCGCLRDLLGLKFRCIVRRWKRRSSTVVHDFQFH
jgi:hypothetical protein